MIMLPSKIDTVVTLTLFSMTRRADNWLRIDCCLCGRLQRVSTLRGARSTAAHVHLLAHRRQQHCRHGPRVGRWLLEHRYGA